MIDNVKRYQKGLWVGHTITLKALLPYPSHVIVVEVMKLHRHRYVVILIPETADLCGL